MSLLDTPRANRLHIGIFGKRNSGKSTLINALTNQETALVSEVAGTTTDPVYKSMEIYGIGPVVFIDTAGFDDKGTLGEMRVRKTKEATEKTDIAIIVISDFDIDEELRWIEALKIKDTPVVLVANKEDINENIQTLADEIKEKSGISPIIVSGKEGKGIVKIREAIIRLLPEEYEMKSIVGDLAASGDSVVLVMPQDIQAPKGRLILPQVQTLRDLLNKKCMVTCCTTELFDQTLESLKAQPQLIITDSQVFKEIYDKKPLGSKLTSFSVLFGNYKGDLNAFIEGAKAIETLKETSRILIAEACTHAPLDEDIGRVKIPNLLRKRVGEGLTVDVVAGAHFPEDLTPYDLIISCGSCMFNRKYTLSRLDRAHTQGVPMSNYGIVLAFLLGILDKIDR
ncbi:MAG: [FeFe] hydrogenase H-cluster maturation GTPase HydF [Eubacteriaceae bacterium]